MKIGHRMGSFRPLVRRSVRYLLISRGFIILEIVAALGSLALVLTGSRIAAIDRLGNRADIVVSILVTSLTILALRAVNRRAMVAIDRKFFREAYDAQIVLTELSKSVRSYSRIEQLVEVAATTIRDALHPVNVTVFLEEDSTGNLVSALSLDSVTFASNGDDHSPELLLTRHGWLASHLDGQTISNPIKILRGDDITDNGSLVSARKSSKDEYWILRRIRSVLLIPIESNGHLYGVISLGRRLGDLAYSDDDKQLLLAIASQMATLIENLKLVGRLAEEQSIKRELEMAAEVQQRMFPAGELEAESLEVYGTCLPARAVGGDYYDYFVARNRRIGIAIADVAGKGMAAALQMSTLQAMLRCQLITGVAALSDLVSAVSRLLRQSTGDAGYATFFFCEFDPETRRLTYINAGHNPPMVVRSGAFVKQAASRSVKSGLNDRKFLRVVSQPQNAVVTLLTEGGPVIGNFLDSTYDQATVQMSTGDFLVAYSDGVTESWNPVGAEFGEERLRSIIVESLDLTARELTERIMKSVKDWQQDAPQHDDITLIVAKVK